MLGKILLATACGLLLYVVFRPAPLKKPVTGPRAKSTTSGSKKYMKSKKGGSSYLTTRNMNDECAGTHSTCEGNRFHDSCEKSASPLMHDQSLAKKEMIQEFMRTLSSYESGEQGMEADLHGGEEEGEMDPEMYGLLASILMQNGHFSEHYDHDGDDHDNDEEEEEWDDEATHDPSLYPYPGDEDDVYSAYLDSLTDASLLGRRHGGWEGSTEDARLRERDEIPEDWDEELSEMYARFMRMNAIPGSQEVDDLEGRSSDDTLDLAHIGASFERSLRAVAHEKGRSGRATSKKPLLKNNSTLRQNYKSSQPSNIGEEDEWEDESEDSLIVSQKTDTITVSPSASSIASTRVTA